MRVHNVTALQHDVDKISSLFLLDACKSTSVKSVHKHFSEISAMPCRNNKLFVLTPMHSYFQLMRAQIEQCAWPSQAEHAQKGLIKHILQPEQCWVSAKKVVLNLYHWKLTGKQQLYAEIDHTLGDLWENVLGSCPDMIRWVAVWTSWAHSHRRTGQTTAHSHVAVWISWDVTVGSCQDRHGLWGDTGVRVHLLEPQQVKSGIARW